jgi:cytochrome c biogenesis protein CcdA
MYIYLLGLAVVVIVIGLFITKRSELDLAIEKYHRIIIESYFIDKAQIQSNEKE